MGADVNFTVTDIPSSTNRRRAKWDGAREAFSRLPEGKSLCFQVPDGMRPSEYRGHVALALRKTGARPTFTVNPQERVVYAWKQENRDEAI